MFPLLSLHNLTKSAIFLDLAFTDQSQLMELFSRIVFEDLAKQNQIKKELNTFLSHWAETEAFFQQRTLQIFTEFEEQHMQVSKEGNIIFTFNPVCHISFL